MIKINSRILDKIDSNINLDYNKMFKFILKNSLI